MPNLTLRLVAAMLGRAPYGTFRLDMTARLPLDPPMLGADSGQFLFEGV